MADRLTAAELDKMQKSVSDMTDLSRNLRVEFNKIKNTTDLLSDNFKKIVSDAGKNQNIAEKYLVAQKVSQTLNEKINELKSKSGYLDNISLKFKKDELDLQKKITTAQISRLLSSKALDAAAKKEAIDALKLKMILSDVELDFLEKNIGRNNSIVDSLNQQLIDTDGILNNIKIINDGEGLRNKLLGFGKKVLGDMGPLGSAVAESFNVAKINPWVLAADAAVAILQKGYENFKAFDKAGVDVRKNLGALPSQATVLERNLKVVTVDMMHLGATFDDVAKSINEIANEFTGLVAQDRDLLRTTTALSKQFGIAEGTSVKFLKTLGGISGNSASSQKSMIGFAQKMAQASGVPLGKIMEDVANASDDVRVYVGSSVVSMIKAATAARMMGIDLNKAATSAEKLLQFESSINAELKASAILGQNINFNYARQLSFNKNIIGANQEILRIAKQVNFNQLNPIQQKAFADAAGKSVGELQDMLTQEKNIQLVRNGTNDKAKKALADYERMMQLKDEEVKNEGKIAEQEILRKANQERMNQLQNKFNQFMSELAQPVMDIVEPLLDLSVAILPGLIAGIKILGVTLAPVASLKFILGIPRFIKAFTGALKGGAGVFKAIGGVGKSIGRVLSTVTKFGGIFGKFLGPLGLIINAFTFIGSLMRRWQETPKGFLGGLEAIGGALYDTFLKPFKDAWDWISGLFVGKSPSELGLGIVKGIKSVGGMLLDVLTMPFRTGYNFISGLFGGSEMKAPSEVLSDITVDSKKAKDVISATDSESLLVQTIQSGNQQLIAKMDQLINMMANGGIAVNLDGQRVQSALSTTSYRFGGFGQSTT